MNEIIKPQPDSRQLAINTLEVVISNSPDIDPYFRREMRDMLKDIREGGGFSPENIVVLAKNALMQQGGMDLLQSDPQFMNALESWLNEQNESVIEIGKSE